MKACTREGMSFLPIAILERVGFWKLVLERVGFLGDKCVLERVFLQIFGAYIQICGLQKLCTFA